MSQKRPTARGGGDTVQIRLDMRAVMIGGGIIAAVLIFVLAILVGQMTAGGSSTAAQAPAAAQPGAPGSQVIQVNPQPGQSQQVQINPQAQPGQAQPAIPPSQGKPSDTPVPVPVSRAPVGPETAVGDNPRLALPELRPTGYIYDFGEIPGTQKVEKAIIIKNDGTKPLEIKDVKSTWGCTASLVSDKVVPPGGQTTVKVSFDPTAEKGVAGNRVTREVKVFTNDPVRPEASFHITAYVRP